MERMFFWAWWFMPIIPELEKVGLGIQGHHWLPRKHEASLSYQTRRQQEEKRARQTDINGQRERKNGDGTQ